MPFDFFKAKFDIGAKGWIGGDKSYPIKGYYTKSSWWELMTALVQCNDSRGETNWI